MGKLLFETRKLRRTKKQEDEARKTTRNVDESKRVQKKKIRRRTKWKTRKYKKEKEDKERE